MHNPIRQHQNMQYRILHLKSLRPSLMRSLSPSEKPDAPPSESPMSKTETIDVLEVINRDASSLHLSPPSPVAPEAFENDTNFNTPEFPFSANLPTVLLDNEFHLLFPMSASLQCPVDGCRRLAPKLGRQRKDLMQHLYEDHMISVP